MNLLPNPQIDIDRYINKDGLIPEIQLNSIEFNKRIELLQLDLLFHFSGREEK